MRGEALRQGRAGKGHWFRQEGGGGSSIVYAGSANADSLTLFGVTAFVFDAAGKFKEKVDGAERHIRSRTAGS